MLSHVHNLKVFVSVSLFFVWTNINYPIEIVSILNNVLVIYVLHANVLD